MIEGKISSGLHRNTIIGQIKIGARADNYIELKQIAKDYEKCRSFANQPTG